MKRSTVTVCAMMALCLIAAEAHGAPGEPAKKDTISQKTKNFVQKLFSYPANVLQGSADVVADTTKRGAGIVATEVKTVGQVVTGDVDKTKDLVIEPVAGAAETAAKAVGDTAQVPIEAAKE